MRRRHRQGNNRFRLFLGIFVFIELQKTNIFAQCRQALLRLLTRVSQVRALPALLVGVVAQLVEQRYRIRPSPILAEIFVQRKGY